MANICEYKVKVKGMKNACYAFFGSMSAMDYKDMDKQSGSGLNFELVFSGNCKWSVDFNCKKWNGDFPVEIPADADDAFLEAQNKYWYYTVQERSKMFEVEVWCNSCDTDGEPDIAIYEHYKNGEPVTDELPSELKIDGTSEVQNAAWRAERDNQMRKQLNSLIGQPDGTVAETSIDQQASSIGETGYDLYRWTFTEGKRKSGEGWSVAIPDGFAVIDSKNNRAFEAVPVGFENETDESIIPIQLLPGIEQENKLDKEMWMYHPYARAGIAALIAVQTSKLMVRYGIIPEIVSCNIDNLMAFSLIQDTSEGTYSYQCRIMTSNKQQALRVQTQYLTDEQKKSLTQSVLEWLKSFKFDKPNEFMPKEAAFESAKVLNDLKKGITASFDHEVDQAQKEYNAAVNGRLRSIQFMEENGLHIKGVVDTIRDILTKGMDVKEFYYIKADEMLEKLKSANVNESVMKIIYKKLKDMKSATTEVNINGEKIVVTETAQIKKIQDKWENEAIEISKLERGEAHIAEDTTAREEAEARRKAQIESFAMKVVKETREFHKKLNDKWHIKLDIHRERISQKVYMSNQELVSDLRIFINDRNDFGTEYDKLIAEIDKKGRKLVEDGCSYQAVKAIYDAITEVINDSRELDLKFTTTGMSNVELGTAEFTFSSSSKEIRKWWKNKYESMPEFQIEKKKKKLERDLSSAETRLNDLIRERQGLDSKSKILSNEIPKLELKVRTTEGGLENAKSEIVSKADSNISEMQSKIAALKIEKTDAIKSIEDIQKQVNSLSFFKFSLKKELTQKIENIREGLPKYTEDIRQLESEITKISEMRDRDVEELQTAVDKDKERLVLDRSELAKLPEMMQRLDKEIEVTTQQVNQLKLNINNL